MKNHKELKISEEVIASLRKHRQKILKSLIEDNKTLGRLSRESIQDKSETQTYYDLCRLQGYGLVTKDKNKVYSLTEKGRYLTESLNRLKQGLPTGYPNEKN